MKNTSLINRFVKSNKNMFMILLAIFLFPIIIGIIYALPLPQVVAVDSGDLLSYYGTAFGIVGSFIMYRNEINKKKKERIRELKPSFVVGVEKIDSGSDVFKIDIINQTLTTISFLYFYDEFISVKISDIYSFKTTFNMTIEQVGDIKPDYNITMDPEILDKDGFPKYVQLLCDDSDGNSWNCCYYKIKDCDKVYYYPRDFEIL